MRNLYKRLNSDRWAAPETLKESIHNCRDKSLQQDAECVFASQRRKDMYDHTHSALVGISQLRNGLGLTHKELWNNQLNTEFNNGKSPPLRLHKLINANTTNPPPIPKYHSAHNRHSTANRAARQRQQEGDVRAKPGTTSGKGFDDGNVVTNIAIAFLAIIGALIFLSLIDTPESTPRSTQTPATQSATYQTPAQIPKNTFNEPVVSPPAHGYMLRHLDVEALAPLEINTSYGEYYFIKMIDTSSGREELELFIHGGRRIEIMMPLGTYTMKYATGKTWYGREHLFGPDTVYSKADSAFKFTEDYRGYSGYTVTLYKVSNGNLETERINASQF